MATAAACAKPEPPAVVRVADAGPIESSVQIAQAKPGSTRVGSYLAARHARTLGDLDHAIDFVLSVLEEDPENPELLRTATMMMTVDGRVEDAVGMAARLMAVKPDADMAHLILAVDDMKNARYDSAESRATGVQGGVATIVVPLVRAWALVGLGRQDEALGALSILEQNRGARALKTLHEGLILDSAGRLEEAEAALRSLTKEGQGRSLRQVLMLGSILERTGRLDEARALYNSFLTDNQGTDLLATTMARLDAGETGRPPVATPQEGLAEGLFAVANSLRRQAGRETAMSLGNMALYLRPSFPPAQLLARRSLRGRGAAGKSQRLLQRDRSEILLLLDGAPADRVQPGPGRSHGRCREHPGGHGRGAPRQSRALDQCRRHTAQPGAIR